ncbi:MAG: VWA domain-containing protein [Bacteroidales bacterium]|nr:VWA domain-containing protein [Bacteroidales bacterium]
MKRTVLIQLMTILFSLQLLANGVCIKDATEAIYFKLLSSEVQVEINNQVSILTTTQLFMNNTGSEADIKYAFPLYEDASPINLRWYVNGSWNTAIFSPSPQDTTLPGGGDPDPFLMEYLGDTPLFFTVPDTILQDSLILVELTYVQLLPYNFNIVDFNYPNDYSNIQSDILDFQIFHLTLVSERTIENINLYSHDNATITNTGNFAEVYYENYESQANTDYFLQYQLNSDELGLFSFSTFLPDSANDCDELGNGFMAFVVEPDPNDSLEIIQKIFTLIVDRSGSMSGDKIIQARNAANFIVNHLNEGDYFNIVDFSSNVTSFSDDHVPFNSSTQAQALSYISNFQANGSTNISGAFTTAISDFSINDTTVANIIIFFTDGQATAGITSTEGILSHIQSQLNYFEVNFLMIHTFGIGNDVNQQLLSMIASQNNGLSEFLLDSELEDLITTFYLRIRNPVLLNTEMTFNPPLIFETYPNPLPNLYLGQQLIVTGRYDESDSVTALFEGEAFGQPQSYTYAINLADSLVEDYSFLIKIWAKMKIENLYIEYFNFDPNSTQAEEIKEEIIEISICYNVLSPFTSFVGGGGGGFTSIEFDEELFDAEDQLITYNYPNPFGDITEIHLKVKEYYYGIATIKIYDMFGRLIHILEMNIAGPGDYSATWKGTNRSGIILPPGHYFYIISYGNYLEKNRMVKF